MKENTLIELKNKVETLGAIVSQHDNALKVIVQELQQLQSLSITTLEVVKNLPGFAEAADVAKANFEKKAETLPEEGDELKLDE